MRVLEPTEEKPDPTMQQKAIVISKCAQPDSMMHEKRKEGPGTDLKLIRNC